MAYEDFLRPGKAQITGDQVAPGAISLEHLDPALFAQIRQINLHTHSGVKSVRIKQQDMDGSYTQDGFFARSPDGSVWQIQIDNAGTLSTTKIS